MSMTMTDESALPDSASIDTAIASRRRLSAQLAEFVRRAAGPDFITPMAGFIGEDEARTEAAFALLFSAAVRRIARAAESRQATERLYARLHGQQVAVDLSVALGRLLGDREAGNRDMPEAADGAAHALYGSKAGSLVVSVGAATGVTFDSVWKLACFVTPFAYAALADYCNRNELDPAGLRRLLASERNGSRRSHRRRLGRSLRESGSRAVDAVFDSGVLAMRRTRRALGEVRARIPEIRPARFALPGLLVLTATVSGVMALNVEPPPIPTTQATRAPTLAPVTLPDGQVLQVPRDGAVSRMAAFLADAGAKGEKVFMLDGIRFDEQSATLRSASRAQLEQVAAVLAAFPGARLVIEVPAEQRGDSDKERELAEQRALAVRAVLGSFGVRPSRMAHAAGTGVENIAETGALRFSDGLIALRVING